MYSLRITLTTIILLLALTCKGQTFSDYLGMTPVQLMAEYGKSKGAKSFGRSGGTLSNGHMQEFIYWYEPQGEMAKVFLVLDSRVVMVEVRTAPSSYEPMKNRLSKHLTATGSNSWVDYSTMTNWSLKVDGEMTTLQVLKCSPCGR